MAPLVKLVLSLLRAASHSVLFLEAQRLAARLLRPTSPSLLAAAEAHVLAGVHAPLVESFAPSPCGPLRALSTAPPATTTTAAGGGGGCDGGGGEALPHLVLLHGHSMSAAFFYRNFDDLAATHRVHAVDLLGWGRSARPPFSGATPDDTLDFYLTSLHAWVSAHRLPPRFALLGHSLGAYLAFEYAKRHPAAVSRLILIAPAAIARPLPLLRGVYFALPPQAIVRRGGLLGFLLFALRYPTGHAYVARRLREYTYHLAALRPPSGELAVRPIVRLHPRAGAASVTRPLLEALDPVRCPVLLVCGETDSSIDVTQVHVLYREMKRRAFDVRIRVVPGADHCPHLEKPDQFYSSVKDFLVEEQGQGKGMPLYHHYQEDSAVQEPPLASVLEEVVDAIAKPLSTL